MKINNIDIPSSKNTVFIVTPQNEYQWKIFPIFFLFISFVFYCKIKGINIYELYFDFKETCKNTKKNSEADNKLNKIQLQSSANHNKNNDNDIISNSKQNNEKNLENHEENHIIENSDKINASENKVDNLDNSDKINASENKVDNLDNSDKINASENKVDNLDNYQTANVTGCDEKNEQTTINFNEKIKEDKYNIIIYTRPNITSSFFPYKNCNSDEAKENSNYNREVKENNYENADKLFVKELKEIEVNTNNSLSVSMNSYNEPSMTNTKEIEVNTNNSLSVSMNSYNEPSMTNTVPLIQTDDSESLLMKTNNDFLDQFKKTLKQANFNEEKKILNKSFENASTKNDEKNIPIENSKETQYNSKENESTNNKKENSVNKLLEEIFKEGSKDNNNFNKEKKSNDNELFEKIFQESSKNKNYQKENNSRQEQMEKVMNNVSYNMFNIPEDSFWKSLSKDKDIYLKLHKLDKHKDEYKIPVYLRNIKSWNNLNSEEYDKQKENLKNFYSLWNKKDKKKEKIMLPSF